MGHKESNLTNKTNNRLHLTYIQEDCIWPFYLGDYIWPYPGRLHSVFILGDYI